MDVLNLLERAQKAGLRIRPKGDKLEIRGPKSAEPIVREIQARKLQVIEALARRALGGLWDRTLQHVAARWEAAPRKVWIDDAALLDAIDAAINAVDEVEARIAIDAWEDAWLAAIEQAEPNHEHNR